MLLNFFCPGFCCNTKVIQTNPGTPEENGAVEGLQATLTRWSNPQKHKDLGSFQKALDESGRIQREVYRVSAKEYKTRISLFPELKTNPRKFSKTGFDFRRIESFLAQRSWTRSVRYCGVVRFMSNVLFVGKAHAGKRVSISFDPLDKAWLIHDTDGTLINKSQRQIISEKEILEFATKNE